SARVAVLERPDDGEALEDDLRGIRQFDLACLRDPAPVAQVVGEPAVAGAVALTLIPGECVVDAAGRAEAQLGGTQHDDGRAVPVAGDPVSTDLWQRLPVELELGDHGGRG